MQIALWNPGEWEWDATPYQRWLADHGAELPDGARAFMTHPAHYDYSAFRTPDSDLPPGTGLCTKDLLLRDVQLDPGEIVRLELRFLFPGFELVEVPTYDLVLRYEAVERFELGHERDGPHRAPSALSHLIIDEAVPTGTGIIHEIGFAHGHVTVESADVEATWR